MFAVIKDFLFGPSTPVSQDILDDIKRTVKDHKVVVYSSSYCPYCTNTQKLLQSLNQEATIIEATNEMKRGLSEITGQRTVPNIFISGKHIGGNSHIQDLHRSGELKTLLA